MVIWLASYPRSGSTLARIATRYSFHLPTKTIYTGPETDTDIVMRKLVVGERTYITFAEMAASPDPYIVKTHELPPENDHPAVYLVRDGRDTLVSYAHFILYTANGIEVGSDRAAFLRVLREIITSNDHFGGWGPNALAWQQRKAPTATIRFEDPVADPGAVLQQALATLGQEAAVRGGESMPSFEDLHAVIPWFFRKGKVGAWRDEMPDELHKLFWERHREAMIRFHYE